MVEKWFELETRSNVIVSSHGVKEGSHETLDYIPGSVFLGMAASGKVEPDKLLSGEIRFTNAMPIVNGKMLLPIPLNYHQAKFSKEGNPEFFNRLYDLTEYSSQQPKQMRSNYIEPGTQSEYKIDKVMSTKTKLDRTRFGASEDNKLFTYQSIPAGMRYIFSIIVTDEIKKSVLAEIIDKITGTVRIGRSRSAEFGHAFVKPMEKPDFSAISSMSMGNEIIIYLQSDLIPEKNGNPMVHPTADMFGLFGSIRLNLRKSFLRTRSYSSWNHFFGTRMTMRHVFTKGSVFTFVDTDKEWSLNDLNQLQEQLNSGVGSYINEGCGQVLVNPKFVVEENLKLKQNGKLPEKLKPSKEQEENIEEFDSPLIDFLLKRHLRMKRSVIAIKQGRKWSKSWKELLEALQRDHQKVPGKTQWSNIREIAVKNREDLIGFLADLKIHCTDPDVTSSNHHKSIRHQFWNAEIRYNRKTTSMYKTIISDVKDYQEEGRYPGVTVDAVIKSVVELSRRLDGREKEA
ncbi:hypothetical protein K8T06_03655 [bacterium]|nr:hypothetical protein [bacterium]